MPQWDLNSESFRPKTGFPVNCGITGIAAGFWNARLPYKFPNREILTNLESRKLFSDSYNNHSGLKPELLGPLVLLMIELPPNPSF